MQRDGCPRRTAARRSTALLLAGCLAGALLACDPPTDSDVPELAPALPNSPNPTNPTWIEVTIGGIPERDRGLLVLPPSGFFIDVHFPQPDAVIPETLGLAIRPWAPGTQIVLSDPVVRRPDGATFSVGDHSNWIAAADDGDSATTGPVLAPGSHTLWATVERRDGATESVSLAVAVRAPTGPSPLAGGQWVQLDFEADRDGDTMPDFPADLATFGLASGLSPAVDIRMESWVIAEIVDRTSAFYRANPSQLPGGDPLAVRFSADPPPRGPYSRICVAGETPGEDAFIGNVLLDPGNLDRSDDACDDFLPSGVFPRELVYYADVPAYEEAFGPLLAAPAGSDPLDIVVLGATYDPGDPDQRARRETLTRGVETFAQAVASVVAHEAGHAMGLVPPGRPGVGLYGGNDGRDFTHNLTPQGDVPEESLLMNPGPTLGFEDLAGSNGTPLPRLRELNFAYLQGRVILDRRVDALHPPPKIESISPSTIRTDGALLEIVEVRGTGLLDSPRVILRGELEFPVLHVANLAGQNGAPDTLIGQVLAPTLAPGRYDVEVTNPDGQSATLRDALEVR